MIENQLEKYLTQSDSNKSSYWKNSLFARFSHFLK